MRPALALTRVQLWALLVAMGGRTRTRRRWSVGGLLAVVALATAALSALYSAGLAAILDLVGAVDLVLVVMAVLAMVGVVAGGTFGVSRSVLAGRDDDLLLALPVRPRTVALAKMAAVTVQNLLLMVLAVVPSGVVYGLYEPTRPWFWPALLAGTLALTLAATAVSVGLALLVALVAPGERGRAGTNVAILVATAAVLVASVPAIQRLEHLLTTDPGAFADTLGRWAWGFVALRDLAVQGSTDAALTLLALGLLPFAAVVALVAGSYVRLTARRSRGAAAVGHRPRTGTARLRAHSPFAALLRREANRLFSSTVYLVNSGFGVVMLVAGAGWLAVGADGVPAGVQPLADALQVPLPVLGAVALCLPVAMTCTTAPSISLEGDRLWILRSAPVDPLAVLGAKAALNVLVVLPALVPAGIVLAVASGASAVEGLLVVLTAGIFTPVIAGIGLLANLLWPVLDAPSDAVVVKQSVSVVAALLAGVAAHGALAVVGLVTARLLGSTAGLSAMALVAAGLALVLFTLLRGWGVRAFNRLG